MVGTLYVDIAANVATAVASPSPGNTVAVQWSVKVDMVAPGVSAINLGVPSNGNYQTGQHLDFTVDFSENVYVWGLSLEDPDY